MTSPRAQPRLALGAVVPSYCGYRRGHLHPAAGYSGPDSFSFDATSIHGTGAAATAAITVGAGPSAPAGAPRDSQPLLSPSTFAALASGPAVVAKTAKGTTISYTDTEVATTAFVVRKAAGNGVLVHGKCVTPPHSRKGAVHGRRCARFTQFGSFSHSDVARANRFRFTGRIGRHALKPGAYQLVSTPTNALGKSGAAHVSKFKIVHG